MFCNIIAVRRWWITKWSSSGWKPNLFLALLYETHGEELNKVSMFHLLTRELTVIVERPWNICSHHWGIDNETASFVMSLSLFICNHQQEYGDGEGGAHPSNAAYQFLQIVRWRICLVGQNIFSICKIFWWRVRIQCVAIYKTYCGTVGFVFVYLWFWLAAIHLPFWYGKWEKQVRNHTVQRDSRESVFVHCFGYSLAPQVF